MTDPITDETTAGDAAPSASAAETGVRDASADPVEAELLVEDVSIDGMCGVY